MDNRTFISRLAKATGFDGRETTRLTDTLIDIIGESGADNNSIAVPGFGSFVTTKEMERIETDATLGERILIPPCISISFTAGSRLKKKIVRQ